MSLRYNKVCEIEDFEAPELAAILEQVFAHELDEFPIGLLSEIADSKQWEIGMAYRTLADHGAVSDTAVVLGVGVGTELTPFVLASRGVRVLATDIYLRPGPWGDVAPTLMLAQPEMFAPIPFDRDRLSVMHMDGRSLRFPDATFDAVFSSGSIEHFGSFEAVANAAFEMGRVLRPGGVLSLSTEFRIGGPPGGIGWEPGTLLFSEQELSRFVVQASGLTPVDELSTSVSPRTVECARDLRGFLSGTDRSGGWEVKSAHYPNLVLTHEGYVFASVHLALRKGDRYPVTDNSWARPSARTLAEIRVADASALESWASGNGHSSSEQSADPSRSHGVLGPLLSHWEMYAVGANNSRVARKLPRPLGAVYRQLLRLRYLSYVWASERRLLHALIDTLDEVERRTLALDDRLERVVRRTADVVSSDGALVDLRARLAELESALGDVDDLRRLVRRPRESEESDGAESGRRQPTDQ